MYVIVVNFELHADHVAEFRAAMLANAKTSLAFEPGCRQFDVCWDPQDDRRVLLYEVYDDEGAFNHHLESKHFKSFNAQTAPWVSSKSVSNYHRLYPDI